jgi:hypothetical protein
VAGGQKLDHADQHAERRQREAGMPAVVAGHDGHEHRSEERADVDADVEDREARVAARAAFGIELTDRGAHVGLEQTDAEDVADQAEEEEARAARREQGVAGRDQHAAGRYRDIPAGQLVGHPAAEERQQVGAAQVQPPDGAGALVVEAEPAAAAGCDQEEDQDRLDAVVSEPLPHLREEEGREAPRVTEGGGLGGPGIDAVGR